jgi:hypothetical protein
MQIELRHFHAAGFNSDCFRRAPGHGFVANYGLQIQTWGLGEEIGAEPFANSGVGRETSGGEDSPEPPLVSPTTI